MNHSNLEVCTCGYSTYSQKWMRKHQITKHNAGNLFRYVLDKNERIWIDKQQLKNKEKSKV